MKKFLSFILVLVWAISVFAVPANRKPLVVRQSDGTMLTIVMQGDEALHFYTTLDGKYVVKGDCGDYYYATFSDGAFASTGVLAHNKNERGSTENELLAGIDYEELGSAVSEIHMARSAKYREAVVTRSAASSRNITRGEVKVPVLLVEYNDVKFTFTKGEIEKLLNEPNYKYKCDYLGVESYGSARDYFIAQSGGLFTPIFVVTDIVTLDQNMSYYGGNSGGSDKNPQAMIREGIKKADASTSMDFSQFDNDKDKNVEFLYCIYAGYSEANGANANTIWPHQWKLSANGGNKELVDGVYCDNYACSSELNMTENESAKELAGIGTICHEFSHCLGLHDVYDVSYKSGVWGMDDWDIMANGNENRTYGYIPVGYNSYQKDLCGWKNLEVLTENGVYSMTPQGLGGVGYKILNDANNNEYFIIEARNSEGWDQSFVAEGVMIIHVDYDKSAWDTNNINTTEGHPRFQIVPADNELLFYNKTNLESFYNSLAGDLWPGKNNKNEFSNTSSPAAKVYTGGYLNKSVTNIRYDAVKAVASFNFVCGEMNVPVAMPATDVSSNSFVANWEAVDYALEYVVELNRLVNVTPGEEYVEKLLEEDFMNCSSSSTTIQENIDTYMSVPGWSGKNIYSGTGILGIGSLNDSGTLVTPKLETEGNVTISAKVAKYNSKAGNIKLVVDVLNASGEVVKTNVVSSDGLFSFDVEVNGEFSVRFSTDAGNENKRVLIDDISVSVKWPYNKELVGEYKTTENFYKFTGLNDGVYAYRVKAVNGIEESEFSKYVKVFLSTATVLDAPLLDEDVVVYTITGVKVCEGTVSALKNLPNGVYVVKSSTAVKKIKIG